MVGVAGKSKACNNCRKRRVKCHFERPYCSRCVKGKLTCTGYGKDLVFVNRTSNALNVTAATVLSDIRRGKLRSHHLSPVIVQTDLHQSLQDVLLPSYHFLELRRRAVKLLQKLYLASDYEVDSNYSQTCWGWVISISDLTGNSQALDMSLQSLCVVQSFVHGITASLEHSLHLYDTALQKLREDVEDHDLKLSKETLATIVVLSTTEMFLNRVDNSWQIHARGISEILKLRGHIVETSDAVWHNLCSRLQTICVLDGLIQRRSLLLTPDCWRKLQGKLHGTNGVDLGKFDQLIDIASEVPVLLEETEGLLERPLGGLGSSPMQGVCLMRTFACILRRLCAWQERLRTTDRSDRPLYWTVPSALSHSNQIEGSEVLFPRVLEFRSLNVAIPLLFAWAIRVQIYDNLIRIYSVIGRASSDIPSFREIFMPQNENFANNTANEYDYTVQGQVDPTFDDGPSMVSSFTEADRLSRLICQGLEYCHKSRMGLLGPQCTTFPSWAIRNYFRHHVGHERELQWCQEFRNMRGEGSRCGIETMTFTDIPDGEFRQVGFTRSAVA